MIMFILSLLTRAALLFYHTVRFLEAYVGAATGVARFDFRFMRIRPERGGFRESTGLLSV
jgi:hypothetical protein